MMSERDLIVATGLVVFFACAAAMFAKILGASTLVTVLAGCSGVGLGLLLGGAED